MSIACSNLILIVRYDVVPDDLVLNNTVQITYDSKLPAAVPVDYDAPAVLDDTKFVPLVPKGSFVPDVEFVLNAYFDVGRVTPDVDAFG